MYPIPLPDSHNDDSSVYLSRLATIAAFLGVVISVIAFLLENRRNYMTLKPPSDTHPESHLVVTTNRTYGGQWPELEKKRLWKRILTIEELVSGLC